jgi:(2Fe-2S) ferredoxin
MSKKTLFELAGQFQGYQFSDRGLLYEIRVETAHGLCSIRLNKACQVELWQSALNRQLQLGDWLLVQGEQSHKKGGVVYKAAKIASMLPVIESALNAPDITMPQDSCSSQTECSKTKPTQILVCQKSSCRKRGSQAVQRCLEKTLNEGGLAEQAKIKETGCLKDCSKGPNLVIGKTSYRKVSEKDVAKLVTQHFKPALPPARKTIDLETADPETLRTALLEQV